MQRRADFIGKRAYAGKRFTQASLTAGQIRAKRRADFIGKRACAGKPD